MKKIFWYILAFFIPVIIFFIASALNGFYPLGDIAYNIYDSQSQYPAIFLQLKNLLLLNFSGGLGFNFVGTAFYYLMSPLNIIIFLFNNLNFHLFYMIIIYLKIGLAGLTMFIFLAKEQNTKNIWTLVFSVAYALCGFISCYYYNVMWLDAVYMLPLILLGINLLVKNNHKLLYLITLTLAIIFNFYTGYMLCIFSIIYFIYKLLTTDDINKKQRIKSFIITSIIVGLISCVVLIPAYYSLSLGKADGYGNTFTNYLEIHESIKYFFYQFTPASFQLNGHTYGPPLIYSSLLALVLFTLFFFNKKISKKEKIIVGIIFIIFFISFNFSLFDYAWQFFQRPVWWQNRYSFIFSAFMIIIAYKTISNLEYIDINKKKKFLLTAGTIILISMSFAFSFIDNNIYRIMSAIFFIVSILMIINYYFMIQNKNFHWIIIIFLFLEIFINNFNDLKKNYTNNEIEFQSNNRQIRSHSINSINDDSFYKMEFVNKHTSNDGMLFNYSGINYFNSVRNNSLINFMFDYFNVNVDSNCGINLDNFNPYLMSLLNVKYLIDYDIPYYEKVFNNYSYSVYENPYPLSVGFMVDHNIKSVALNKAQYQNNINEIFSKMTGTDVNAYKIIAAKEFKADKDYLVLAKDNNTTDIVINGQKVRINNTFNLISKGDTISALTEYRLIDIEEYERVMSILNNNLLEVTKFNNGIKGKIKVDEKKYLLITIPYDKGLSIYVNGQKKDLEILMDTFIGVELDSGNYEIEVKYFPYGLKTGLIISIGGILIGAIYIFKTRKDNGIIDLKEF